MEKINFKNNEQPAINDTNLNLMQDNIENELNAKVNTSDLIDLVYPIGAVYISVNNVSPATLFGGTWEQIKDKFLLSAGDTYNAGDEGGEATHTLTIDEMPSHNHTWGWRNSAASGSSTWNSAGGDKTGTSSDVIGNTGGGKPHNNMPPYLVVFVWKRTA